MAPHQASLCLVLPYTARNTLGPALRITAGHDRINDINEICGLFCNQPYFLILEQVEFAKDVAI